MPLESEVGWIHHSTANLLLPFRLQSPSQGEGFGFGLSSKRFNLINFKQFLFVGPIAFDHEVCYPVISLLFDSYLFTRFLARF